MLHNQTVVVEVALDCEGARGFDLFGVRVSSDEASDGVALADEQLEDIPADEARADDEDALGRAHAG